MLTVCLELLARILLIAVLGDRGVLVAMSEEEFISVLRMNLL